MLKHENPKVQKLLSLGDVHFNAWPDYLSLYGFCEDDIDDLIELATHSDFEKEPEGSKVVWGPVHAWRALGQLKAVKAIEPLIECFDVLFDDDVALTELANVFGLIGAPAIEPLTEYLKAEVEDEFSHVLAIDSLTKIAGVHKELRSEVLAIFKQYMRDPWLESYTLNGLLMGCLLDLKAVELIDEIRYLFSIECVDWSCAGDLEEVEMLLGLREKRSTVKPGPMDFYKSKLGSNADEPSDEELDEGYELDADTFSDLYGAPATFEREGSKIGRNDPCPCGSGKKYKKCCG